MFTGARVNELAQLHLDDFKLLNGVWCVDINDQASKRLKNTSSRRIIPLHPFLVEDLGLVRYVESIKAKGCVQFIPELKPTKDGYGTHISRWFNQRFKPQCGIVEQKKTFHSFRHTFITHLAQQEVNDHMLKRIVGHSEESITFGTYSKGFPADQLMRQVIMNIFSIP